MTTLPVILTDQPIVTLSKFLSEITGYGVMRSLKMIFSQLADFVLSCSENEISEFSLFFILIIIQ